MKQHNTFNLPPDAAAAGAAGSGPDEFETEEPEEEGATAHGNTSEPGRTSKPPTNSHQTEEERASTTHPDKPAITLSLTVDPTSDPEKLEKQLKLLRQYGVI